MRHCLCALLLSCVLGFGSLTANDITAAQAQQIVSVAQGAQPNVPAKVTLSLGGKNVEFTVVRDAVGNVSVTPVPGPDSAGITIARIDIQLKTGDKGLLKPESLVVVTNTKATIKYELAFAADGSIASLTKPGGGNADDKSKDSKVQGGIGGTDGTLGGKKDGLPKDKFVDASKGQLKLPAGTTSGAASGSKP